MSTGRRSSLCSSARVKFVSVRVLSTSRTWLLPCILMAPSIYLDISEQTYGTGCLTRVGYRRIRAEARSCLTGQETKRAVGARDTTRRRGGSGGMPERKGDPTPYRSHQMLSSAGRPRVGCAFQGPRSGVFAPSLATPWRLLTEIAQDEPYPWSP